MNMIDHEKTSSEAETWWLRRWKECWNQPSETARHYYHILLALVMFFSAQIITCAWSQPFWAYGLNFPAQIVAMVFLWLAMWAIQAVLFRPGEGLESFYNQHLRAPTEILNKHMSIGFTVPFLSLISQSFVGMRQVGLLTAAFVVTGILNAILVYAVAYHLQLWTTKAVASWTHFRERSRRGRRNRRVLDIKTSARVDDSDTFHQQQAPQSSCVPPALLSTEIYGGSGCGGRDSACPSCLERFRKHISDVSTLCTLSGYTSDSNGPNMANLEGQGAQGGRPADALWALVNNGYCISGGEGAEIPASGARHRCGLVGVAKAVSIWVQHNVFLTLSVLLFTLIGLPLSCLRHEDLFLDIGFVFTVWLTFTSAQTRVKQHIAHQGTTPSMNHHRHYNRHHHHHLYQTHHPRRIQRHRKSLTTLAALLNPVLWTSLFLLCYALAKSHIRGQPTATIVAQFKTGNTISDVIAHHINVSNLSSDNLTSSHSRTSTSTIPFGAGDLATSVLNAGIVSWGLKLFEYRAHLVSRGGLTVLLTTATAALLNVTAWPLLVSRMGVRPAASALSFAARSVTIALGGPAMESVGGDAGVNAVGAVVNGICFQLVAGLLLVRREDGVVEGENMGRFPPGTLSRPWARTAKNMRWIGSSGWGRSGVTRNGCGSQSSTTLETDHGLPTPRGHGDACRHHRDGYGLRYSSDATRTEEQQQRELQHQHQEQEGGDGATSGSKSHHRHKTVQTTPPSEFSPAPATQDNSSKHDHEDIEANATGSSSSSSSPSSCCFKPNTNNNNNINTAQNHSYPSHHHQHPQSHHQDDNDNNDNNNNTTNTSPPPPCPRCGSSSSSSSANLLSTVATVADGITIGVNAAAMGTSHLYEQKSPAAAYSALAMTTFGVFTVLLTVRGPLAGWLVGAVASG